jgi:hypothetical protein
MKIQPSNTTFSPNTPIKPTTTQRIPNQYPVNVQPSDNNGIKKLSQQHQTSLQNGNTKNSTYFENGSTSLKSKKNLPTNQRQTNLSDHKSSNTNNNCSIDKLQEK